MTSRYRRGYAFTPNTEREGLEKFTLLLIFSSLVTGFLTFTEYLVVMVRIDLLRIINYLTLFNIWSFHASRPCTFSWYIFTLISTFRLKESHIIVDTLALVFIPLG